MSPHLRVFRFKRSLPLVLSLAVGTLALTAVPAAEDYAKLYPDLQTPFTAVEDIVYGQKMGMGLTFDVLTPEEGVKGIGVILISSGSWKSEKSNLPERTAERRRDHWGMGLLHSGYTVFVVRHGSQPRFRVPEMIEDIRRSVRFIRLHAADYGIDPDRIGLVGGSSGGHLALMTSTTADDGDAAARDPVERVSSRVQCVLAWFPPTDMVNWSKPDGYKMIENLRPDMFGEMFGEITDIVEQLRSISPYYFVTPDDPPLLLIHGTSDLTVPIQQSRVMEEKYRATGLPVKLVVVEKGGHTYWPGIEDQYVTIEAWFDEHLR